MSLTLDRCGQDSPPIDQVEPFVVVSIDCLEDGLKFVIGQDGRQTSRDEGTDDSCKRQNAICLVLRQATFQLACFGEAFAALHYVLDLIAKLVLPVKEVSNALPKSI